MGVIDKLWFKVTCQKCGLASSVSDGGSGWSGSYWGSTCTFEHFDVQIVGGGAVEPSIASATCKACKTRATVAYEYGFNRPKGY